MGRRKPGGGWASDEETGSFEPGFLRIGICTSLKSMPHVVGLGYCSTFNLVARHSTYHNRLLHEPIEQLAA